jgi:hypothetical protein
MYGGFQVFRKLDTTVCFLTSTHRATEYRPADSNKILRVFSSHVSRPFFSSSRQDLCHQSRRLFLAHDGVFDLFMLGGVDL